MIQSLLLAMEAGMVDQSGLFDLDERYQALSKTRCLSISLSGGSLTFKRGHFRGAGQGLQGARSIPSKVRLKWKDFAPPEWRVIQPPLTARVTHNVE